MLIERLNNAARLWRITMPHIPNPDDRQFIRWLDRFDDALVERAILRASRRFSPERMTSRITSDSVHKFVTGLMLNLQHEADAKPPQRLLRHFRRTL